MAYMAQMCLRGTHTQDHISLLSPALCYLRTHFKMLFDVFKWIGTQFRTVIILGSIQILCAALWKAFNSKMCLMDKVECFKKMIGSY